MFSKNLSKSYVLVNIYCWTVSDTYHPAFGFGAYLLNDISQITLSGRLIMIRTYFYLHFKNAKRVITHRQLFLMIIHVPITVTRECRVWMWHKAMVMDKPRKRDATCFTDEPEAKENQSFIGKNKTTTTTKKYTWHRISSLNKGASNYNCGRCSSCYWGKSCKFFISHQQQLA